MPVTRMAPKGRKVYTKCELFSKYEDGKVRKLIYTANAMADFEQETGMGFAQLMQQKALYASARGFLWAGLKKDDRALTIEDAGELIGLYLNDEDVEPGDHNINAILAVCMEAAVDQGALGRMKRIDDEEELTKDDTKPKEAKKIGPGATVVEDDPNAPSATQKPTS